MKSVQNTLLRYILLLAIGAASHAIAAAKTPDNSPTNTLIVPGERIGGILLGSDSGPLERKLGNADYSEGVMGGKGFESWYLGTKHGDKGRPFHRPDEIGITFLRDMEHDSSEHPGKAAITQIYVTSPRFATAEGIAPGSTLEAIRAKFPGIQPEQGEISIFPMYGEMQFFMDAKQGIAFEVRKSDGVCIQVSVVPREGSGMKEFFTWGYTLAAQDYVIDDINGTVGDIKLGMTGAKLLALLGKPDEKRDVTTTAGGVLWRWRVPAQRPLELPALCVYLRKLPDGSLIVEQIRLSSRAFALTDKIFPGCPLKDALEATGNISKLDSYKEISVDIYGDLRAGLLFDVRQGDSVCTAITIFPALLDVHRDMGARWLDLPVQPAAGD